MLAVVPSMEAATMQGLPRKDERELQRHHDKLPRGE